MIVKAQAPLESLTLDMVEVEFKAKGLPRSMRIHGKKCLRRQEIKEASKHIERMEEQEKLRIDLSHARIFPQNVHVFAPPEVNTKNKLAKGYSYIGKIEILRYFLVLGNAAFERKSRWRWEFRFALLRLQSGIIEIAAKEGKKVFKCMSSSIFDMKRDLRYDWREKRWLKIEPDIMVLQWIHEYTQREYLHRRLRRRS